MTKQNKILITCGAVLLSIIAILLVIAFMKKEEEPIIYKVTFDTNGGSVISEQLITEGDKATRPENPTKEGYEFGSWQYNNETFDFNTSVNENIILKAEWIEIEVEKEPEKVIIKFTTNGGTKISNQEIIKGENAVKPETPKREGYIFKGWYLNNKEYNFNTSVNEDIELIAKWEKETEKEDSSSNNSEEQTKVKKYTITFDSKGGSAVSKQTVEEGKTAKKPANPTKKGYTFVGWTLNGNAYNFDKKVTSNITLTATWQEVVKKNYTVTFDSKGGNAVDNQTVLEGNKVRKPANPTREGYTFKNWTLNGKNYNFDNAVKGNITLVATWSQKTYTIKSVKADAYSPDAKLSVYENGSQISVKSIKYSDGTLLCNGTNTTVAVLDIEGETSFIVVLKGGTEVRATLQ